MSIWNEYTEKLEKNGKINKKSKAEPTQNLINYK